MSTQPKGRDSSGQGGRIRRQPERNSLSAQDIKNLIAWMQAVADRDELFRQLKEEDLRKRRR